MPYDSSWKLKWEKEKEELHKALPKVYSRMTDHSRRWDSWGVPERRLPADLLHGDHADLELPVHHHRSVIVSQVIVGYAQYLSIILHFISIYKADAICWVSCCSCMKSDTNSHW